MGGEGPIVEVDVAALRAAFLADTTALASFVRRAPTLDVPAPSLTWSVAEVVAHLTVLNHSVASAISGVDLAAEWARMPGIESLPPPEPFGARAAAVNNMMLSLYLRMTPESTAETYQDSCVALLEAWDRLRDPHAASDVPWLSGELPASTQLAFLVTETLLHGQDIAKGLRQRLALSRQSGRVAVPAVLTTFMPITAVADRFRDDDLRFDFRFRGTDARFTLHLDHGVARTLRYEPGRHDAVILIEPTAAIRIAFGRITLAQAIAQGDSWGWGVHALRTLSMPGNFQAP